MSCSIPLCDVEVAKGEREKEKWKWKSFGLHHAATAIEQVKCVIDSGNLPPEGGAWVTAEGFGRYMSSTVYWTGPDFVGLV
jgi:hypothetical protein